MAETRDLSDIGRDILFAARNSLYMSFPYLDVALCALPFLPGGGATVSLATDGAALYYDAAWLSERYLRSAVLTNRAYLHVIFHCMLRHIGKARGKMPELWDLACDAAVEALLEELDEYPVISEGFVPQKRHFLARVSSEMKVVTAEGVYRYLLRHPLPDYERAALQRAFQVDDHGLWDPQNQDQQRECEEQDRKWQDISGKTQTAMETSHATEATGGESVLEQVRAAVRNDVDYRAFLRRFAAPREIMQVDGDAFDYIFYTYGLQLYGNLPLVEPPETKEEKRIEDLVIAIDTSMSTSGELVREFLACTYAILRSTETFTRKVNIRILQCDDQVRRDDAIRDLSELKDYMEHFQLHGGSATDFRPVFAHVEELEKAGAFTSLRGLIYFTDGMGVYPKKRPHYETAFVLLEEPPLSIRMPAWATKLVLGEGGLKRTHEELEELLGDVVDFDELPRT